MVIQRVFKNKNFRNGVLFALFSFFNTGINFLVMMVMAKFIAPDSYGKLSLFTAMVSLLSIFISLNTNGFIGVSFFSSSKAKIQRLLNVVLLTTLVVYLVILSVMCLFRPTFEQISGLTITYQFYSITFCLLSVINASLLDIWRLEEKVWRYGTFSVLSVVCNLVLTILFVGFFNWDWQGRMYAQIITCAVFSFFAVYILIKKDYLHKVFPKKKDFLGAYKFGIPLIPHTTSFWLRQGLDRYIINSCFAQTAVGFFSFAYSFANIIQIVGIAFNASYSVSIYKTLAYVDAASLKTLQRNCRYLIGIFMVITLFVCFCASLFIPAFFPKYKDCVIYLLPLCGGSMFQCFYLVYVNILFYYKKTPVLMYITFVTSLLHCVLSFLFTKYGVIYTAYISLLSSLLIFIGVYVYSQKVLCAYAVSANDD